MSLLLPVWLLCGAIPAMIAVIAALATSVLDWWKWASRRRSAHSASGSGDRRSQRPQPVS